MKINWVQKWYLWIGLTLSCGQQKYENLSVPHAESGKKLFGDIWH
jgi:hypothetical protein